MPPIVDLRSDAKTFRRELSSQILAIAAENESSPPICALEIGYDCDQGGWIFIHADRRDNHDRDGEWTVALEDNDVLEMDHWEEAMESVFEGKDVKVWRYDGSSFVIEAYDEKSEQDDEANDSRFADAVGRMILEVVKLAKADGVFAPLGAPGTIQIDIEDSNGAWAWPEYEELGQINLV